MNDACSKPSDICVITKYKHCKKNWSWIRLHLNKYEVFQFWLELLFQFLEQSDQQLIIYFVFLLFLLKVGPGLEQFKQIASNLRFLDFG